MSTHQKRAEIVTFGYVNRNHIVRIAPELIKIIQMFYDESYFYWILNNKKLKKFINAKNGERIVCPKSFSIQGIKFKLIAYPNGVTSNNKGIVTIGLLIPYCPIEVEYAEFYQEIKCVQSKSVVKKLCKLTTDQNIFGGVLCVLSELNYAKMVVVSVMVDIKYIKYKTIFGQDPIDYCLSLNAMHKHSKFSWNINDVLSRENDTIHYHKNKVFKRAIYSDNFDNNNWCLTLYRRYDGRHRIGLNCLYLPYSVDSMDIQFSIYGKDTFIYDTVNVKHGKCIVELTRHKELSISLFTCSFTVELKIIKIYDENGVVDEDKWKIHGIKNSKSIK